ncbi:sugar ABC transporter permease [Schleiferilactobacillus harbinensis]|uniref:carbohydrate ABC transporter permease n=1 Tax=Schleiferilactobacillus harbinensis TaxID=304207 RepID=UPI0021A686A3|nr:sugar ABC transporter permease [Schleiferilactobacillus harbinensis]MCT2909594.1 sugar ABC transporter permease [Schleiferilactobacillus harbinensis]
MHNKSDKWWNMLFAVPTTLIFALVVLVPFCYGIYYAFFQWDGIAANPMTFVGFRNFANVFKDTQFMSSAVKTLIFTAAGVITINIFGMIIALLVTSKLKTRSLVRTFYFMPYLIGGLILGYIWKFIFSDGMAIIGQVTGLKSIFFNWLLSPNMAMVAMVVVFTWQMAGYIMIIYITGINAIPTDMIEAAQIDGADSWHIFWKVKIPLMMPSITIALFMTLSNCFKIFDVNLSLTGGGPAKSTELFAMNIYNEIFKANNYGYGQAKAILFFLVVAVFTLIQVSITRKREVTM